MSFDLEKIYGLLPAITRARDVEQGEPLRALLTVIAEQVAVLEEDLAQSYDDHFIETCADWVAPYIGDLVGYRALHDLGGKVPGVGSPRAEVANTIGYRRRKGTVAALQQLAQDVTGWNARVVEFFQRLATTQHMNHLRPGVCSPDLGGLSRDLSTGNLGQPGPPRWEPLARLNGPFDTLAHTLDVRRIPPRRGRYNVPNIGVFLWRLNRYPLTDATARRLDDRRYFFSPIGRDTPLFTLPETRAEFSGPANRLNVPDPIGRRTLAQSFADYYGPGKSFWLKDAAGEIAADEITVCDLSDLPGGGWAHQPRRKIAVDPVLGRIAFPALEPPPAAVRVTFQSGFSADLGGGEYDRAATVADAAIFRQTTVWQIGVGASLPPEPGKVVHTFGEALAAWNAQPPGTVGVIVVMDSASYPVAGTDEIHVAAGSKLLLIAGDWPVEDTGSGRRGCPAGQFNASGHRPHLRGDLTVRGEAAGGLYLNGLLIEGRLRVEGATFGQVSVRHCTLVPGISVRRDQFPPFPGEASLRLAAPDVGLEIDHSIVGGLRVHETVSTGVTASIIDATSPCGVAFSGLDDVAAGGTLSITNSTLIGKVHTDLLALATNTIFLARLAWHDPWTAPVWSEQRQAGCVRFSYVPPGSRTPRRYRCQPAGDGDAVTVVPQFGSLRYGDPDYAQLSRRCPDAIFQGADDESEMGAFHDLFEPQRITNLEVRLAEYLRFGLEAGIFFEPQFPRSPAVAPLNYAAVVDLCGDPVEHLPGIGTGLI